MRKILIGIGIIGTLWASSVPASAQYSFNRRIDPSNCYWWQTCDYGGRAYRGHRHHHHSTIIGSPTIGGPIAPRWWWNSGASSARCMRRATLAAAAHPGNRHISVVATSGEPA